MTTKICLPLALLLWYQIGFAITRTKVLKRLGLFPCVDCWWKLHTSLFMNFKHRLLTLTVLNFNRRSHFAWIQRRTSFSNILKGHTLTNTFKIPQKHTGEDPRPHPGLCHKHFLSSDCVWLPWAGCQATVAALICTIEREQGIPPCLWSESNHDSVSVRLLVPSQHLPSTLPFTYSHPAFTLCSVS